MNIDWPNTPAALWRGQSQQLRAVKNIAPTQLSELLGIEEQKAQLVANTQRFVNRQPANNALLWGARGTGKSSLAKAVLHEFQGQGLRLIEIYKHDLHNLPEIVDHIRELPYQFIIYCDDFSFTDTDNSYIVLKTILEGSIEAPPDNVLLYATSNRRHLLPENIRDNDATQIVEGELHYGDAVEEKISLSDRFGLWLSFYPTARDDYFAIVDSYFPNHPNREQLHRAARQFAQLRASHSGRTAKQFFNAYSGEEK